MNHALFSEEYHKFSEYTESLNGMFSMHAFSEKCYHCLEQKLKKRKYNRGEIIFSELDLSEGIFLVRSGLVKLTKQDENGKEFIVSIKKQGEVFAESCLFNPDISYYTYTATMIQDGEVVFIDSSYIENEIQACPQLSATIIRLMSQQLEEYSARLFEMAHSDIFSKMVKTIENLTKKYGKEMNNVIYIDLPISMQDLSMLVGASRESTSRAFSKLKKNDVIDIKKKRIIIQDRKKFYALLQ